MCLIHRFVNSWFCPDHDVVLEADLIASVPNGARQSGYKGRKCAKCQRMCIIFISSVALVIVEGRRKD
jgi:hypothetical protein